MSGFLLTNKKEISSEVILEISQFTIFSQRSLHQQLTLSAVVSSPWAMATRGGPMHPPQGAYVLGSWQTLRCTCVDWCVLQDAERGSWGTLGYNQNYEGGPWVWWDPGEGPLIHTGLTLIGQTRERRRQGCVFQIEGAAHEEADRKRA